MGAPFVVLLDKRPGEGADEGVAQADEPGLGPVQLRIGRLLAHEAEGVESVVRGPFTLERFHGPVPHLRVRMLLPDGRQLPLEIGLANLEGGFELEVGGGDGVVHSDEVATEGSDDETNSKKRTYKHSNT